MNHLQNINESSPPFGGIKVGCVIIGPAHPLRGGLATFNHKLALAFQQAQYDVQLYSYSLQYPSLLFPGTTQYTTEAAPKDLIIHSKINSINPVNWIKVGNELKKLKPDIIIVRYWLPFMGPCLGTILRRVKKNKHTKIICLADNIIPHEKRFGDKVFTKYFIKPVDAFITMSEKVLNDLSIFNIHKPRKLVHHPLYDNFGEALPINEAREHLQLPIHEKIILFFGFIRHYKGLDILLEAMSDERIRQQNIKLLIAGEFYEDEKPYHQIIQEKKIQDLIYLHTHFIPDTEVKYYLSAADVVVQPYRNATQSGVTPLAYHFEIPMIVTNVGGLPALVPHQKVGLVTEPTSLAIADALIEYFALGKEYFIPNLHIEKQKYTWENLLHKIIELANDISK